MVATKETHIYRNTIRNGGPALDPKQRENLLKPYLPSPSNTPEASNRSLTRPLRHFVKTQIHVLVFTVIHTLFSLYIRARQIYHVLIDRLFALLYYHHRAPELIKQDVRGLSRLPEHLSVILELKGEDRGLARLDELMDEVAEISAWCACVGIPMLSIYEKTGGHHSPGLIPTSALCLRFNRNFKRIHPDHPPSCFLQASCLFRPSSTFSSNPCPSYALVS